MKLNWLFPMAVASVLVGGGYLTFMKGSERTDTTSHIVEVQVPELSVIARIGAKTFAENCVECHGDHAGGTEQGPPLIHRYYEPGHHADGAFYLAAQRGVRAHHWPFGDMPPQPQMSKVEMSAVVRYIREVQQHNGIY